MSLIEPQSTDPAQPAKRRIQRRHGACEPCRSSKTKLKCDGRVPCGACRSERRRMCPCVYSEKVMRLQQVTAEIRRRDGERMATETARFHSPVDDSDGPPAGGSGTDSPGHSFTGTRPNDNTRRVSPDIISVEDSQPESWRVSVSVCSAIDEFKKIKVSRGHSSQVIARCSGSEAVSKCIGSCHGQLSASANGEPDHNEPVARSERERTNQEQSEIQALSNRVDGVSRLVSHGRLTRAWIDLASIVREVQFQDPIAGVSRVREDPQAKAWKQLWIDILHLESQLGLTLGRPTCLVLSKSKSDRFESMGFSSMNDEDLDATKLDLFQHIQTVLSLQLDRPDSLRKFAQSARDILTHERFNHVGLCTTKQDSVNARDLHLNTHQLFMVIYCRLASLSDVLTREVKSDAWSDEESTDLLSALVLHEPRVKLAFCRKVSRSATFILSAFVSLYQDSPEETAQNWIRCHNAYVAATLLGIAKLRHEFPWNEATEHLRKVEEVFLAISKRRPDCELFQIALGRLQEINSVKEPSSETVRNKHSGVKNRRKTAVHSTETSPAGVMLDSNNSADVYSNVSSPARPTKRKAETMEGSETETIELNKRPHRNQVNQYTNLGALPIEAPSYDTSVLNPYAYYQDVSTSYSNSFTSETNSNTNTGTSSSFTEYEQPMYSIPGYPYGHPGPPYAYPLYPGLRPPMAWTTMEDTDPSFSLSVQSQQFLHIASPLRCEIPQDDQYSTSAESTTRISSPLQIISPGQPKQGSMLSLANGTTSLTESSNFQSMPDINTVSDNGLISATTSASFGDGQSIAVPGPVKTVLQTEHPCQTVRTPLDRRHSANMVTQRLNSRLHHPEWKPDGANPHLMAQPSLMPQTSDMLRSISADNPTNTQPHYQHLQAHAEHYSSLTAAGPQQTMLVTDPTFQQQQAYMHAEKELMEPYLHTHPYQHPPEATWGTTYVQSFSPHHDNSQAHNTWRGMSIQAGGGGQY